MLLRHLVLLYLCPHLVYCALSPEQIRCQLTRVHLQSGDSMSFQLNMHSVSSNTTSLPGDVATSFNATCHWIVVARTSEEIPFDDIATPTVQQVKAGLDSVSATTNMFGSFEGLDTIMTETGISSDFGQLMFVVVTTTDSTHGVRSSAIPRRLHMPRRCRYVHQAVVTPARWTYKTNITTNLADHGMASFPLTAPKNKNANPSSASLASRLYISGGTYDSGYSWRNPLSGTFKATGYWIDPIHSGRAWKYYPNSYSTSSSMRVDIFPPRSTRNIPGTGSSPSLARTQRRLFGMEATMPDAEMRLIFHLGGINEIDGILKRTDILRISTADGSNGYWDTLSSDWSLNTARHSIASASWKHPTTNQIHLLVVGGNTENGATLNDVEMLILPASKYLQTEFIQGPPSTSFHRLNGTLLVPRSRASAVVVDNHLYVIGGELALRGEVERCNLLEGCQEFVQIAPLRKPRYAGAAIWSNEMNEIMYIGGFRVGQYCDYNQQCTDDAPTYVNLVAGPSTDVESYHIATDSWNTRGKLQVARYGLAVAEIVVPNEGYQDHSNDVDVYAREEMRHQLVAIGGVGGLVWDKQTPMTPRRLSTVEIFSCFQYSTGERHGLTKSKVVGFGVLIIFITLLW